MLQPEFHIGFEQGPDRVGRVFRLGAHRANSLCETLEGTAADRIKNLFLALEIDVDTGLRKADACGQLARREVFVALLEKELFGGRENLGAALVAQSARLASRPNDSDSGFSFHKFVKSAS